MIHSINSTPPRALLSTPTQDLDNGVVVARITNVIASQETAFTTPPRTRTGADETIAPPLLSRVTRRLPQTDDLMDANEYWQVALQFDTDIFSPTPTKHQLNELIGSLRLAETLSQGGREDILSLQDLAKAGLPSQGIDPQMLVKIKKIEKSILNTPNNPNTLLDIRSLLKSLRNQCNHLGFVI